MIRGLGHGPRRYLVVNPWVGWIGWCHSCGTIQGGDEARWLPMMWDRGHPDWACLECDDEPWSLGIMALVCPAHTTPDLIERARAREVIDLPDWDSDMCADCSEPGPGEAGR